MKSKCRQNRILKDLYRELHKVGLPKTGKEKLWVLNENDEPKLYIHRKNDYFTFHFAEQRDRSC